MKRQETEKHDSEENEQASQNQTCPPTKRTRRETNHSGADLRSHSRISVSSRGLPPHAEQEAEAPHADEKEKPQAMPHDDKKEEDPLHQETEKDEKEEERGTFKNVDACAIEKEAGTDEFQQADRQSQEEDARQAFELYLSAAKQGHAAALFWVGWCFDTGTGVDKDDKEAARWWRCAAEKGHHEAQSSLAWNLDHGRGVDASSRTEGNQEEASKWYLAAAKQGVAMAQYQVAKRFHRGQKGFQQDLKEAARWYVHAARANHPKAVQVLNYFPPRRLRTNMVRWYLLVEEGGAPAEVKTIAKFNLELCLHRAGERAKAWSWLQAAAEEGHWLCRLATAPSRDVHSNWAKEKGEALDKQMDMVGQGRHIAHSLVDACTRVFVEATVHTWNAKVEQLAQQFEKYKKEIQSTMPTEVWEQLSFPANVSQFFQAEDDEEEDDEEEEEDDEEDDIFSDWNCVTLAADLKREDIEEVNY
ncbi:Eukaryotic translation initiation factor 5B [Balamuthia mandrillaris]